MKHRLKVTLLLLILFFLSQLIGLVIMKAYSPELKEITEVSTGKVINITSYNLPYGTEPPKDTDPKVNFFSIIVALIIAITVMYFLMKFGAESLIRFWFFFVVSLSLGISFNAFLGEMLNISPASIIALIIAIPLSFLKVYKRNIIIHNFTEILIYPGIAVIFVPLLNIWTVILLLVLISLYDMYAVWHSGFMQKMAKYQMTKIRVFSGFFVPYLSSKDYSTFRKIKKSNLKNKKIKVSVAILGGGDVAFPIILAGVILRNVGLFEALLVSVGATIALAGLFYLSEKGKFYPAMPFISAGCFLALLVGYLI